MTSFDFLKIESTILLANHMLNGAIEFDKTYLHVFALNC